MLNNQIKELSDSERMAYLSGDIRTAYILNELVEILTDNEKQNDIIEEMSRDINALQFKVLELEQKLHDERAQNGD